MRVAIGFIAIVLIPVAIIYAVWQIFGEIFFKGAALIIAFFALCAIADWIGGCIRDAVRCINEMHKLEEKE